MKYLLAAALLAMPLAAPAQTDKSKLKIEYDRFKDKTTVSTPILTVAEQLGERLAFTMTAIHDGKNPQKPGAFFVGVGSMSTRARFTYDRELIFLLDGERFKAGSMLRVNTDHDRGAVQEMLVLPFTLSDLSRITSAKRVEAKAGEIEFTFNTEQMEILKEFLKYFQP